MDYFLSNTNKPDLYNIFAQARLIRLMQASTNPQLLREPVENYYLDQGIPSDNFIDDSLIIQKIIAYKELEIPPKFIRTRELIEKIISKNEKVVVWATFVKNILELSDYLSSMSIYNKVIYGDTPIEQEDMVSSEETREGIIREFHDLNGLLHVLIANPFAVSESISLHKVCHNAIYIERTFNAAARAGQIAHINRIMPHTWDKKNTGIRYCTLTVRHGPVSA
jgi:hypothetical protein